VRGERLRMTGEERRVAAVSLRDLEAAELASAAPHMQLAEEPERLGLTGVREALETGDRRADVASGRLELRQMEVRRDELRQIIERPPKQRFGPRGVGLRRISLVIDGEVLSGSAPAHVVREKIDAALMRRRQ